jgi:hypothetical protein
LEQKMPAQRGTNGQALGIGRTRSVLHTGASGWVANSVMTPGCLLRGGRIEGSILTPGTCIEAGAEVNRIDPPRCYWYSTFSCELPVEYGQGKAGTGE